MTKKYSVLLIGILQCLQIFSANREVLLLDKDWYFINKEIINGESEQADYSAWQKVSVPHDWAITGNFDMNLDKQYVQVSEDNDKEFKLRTGRTGALPMFGVGWYSRALPISNEDNKKRIYIEFDGAMSLAKVYVNGNFAGEWPYGYSSFSFDITKYIQFDKKNTLAVRMENKPESSRWYAGAGIYRNVRLLKTNPVHVAHWGTYITTPVVNKNLAVINVKTEINCTDNQTNEVQLVTEIYSKEGLIIGTVSSKQKSAEKHIFNQELKILKPDLWSVSSPNLYSAVSKVYVNKQLVDTYKSTFGCRSIRFDKDKGFYLNEKPLKIKGVCLHHDLGPLGAAVNKRATERQLLMMKEMGANAIRTSHNPPSPELLELCDSIGLMVQVEAFDEWRIGKNQNGYHNYFDQWAEKDVRNMVQRDRNHPSVIMWSLGNEIRDQRFVQGKETTHFLTSICREEDPSRPVTAGFNRHSDAIKNGLTDEVDLIGLNYKTPDYKTLHAKYPNYIFYGSETASTVSTRGEYKFPVKEVKGPWYNNYQLSSYDMEYAYWASTPDTEFEMQDDCDFILGEFVWTGFDYLGEPSPYNEGTPAKSSYFGIVDLAGLKKDRFYLYQSKWSDKPVLHVLPHWNWPDRLGQNVPVFCYTNYPKAELFVNGKSMGVKEKDKSTKYSRYRLMWNDVIYQPGEIKVIAYNENNKVVAEQVIKTAGEPYSVQLTADKNVVIADGKDLCFVTVEVLDKDGNLCPKAENFLFLEVKGTGKLKAVCNGNPIDQTSFSSNYMHVFNGKMVAVIEPGTDIGEIKLNVSGGRLFSKELIIKTK